MDPVLSTLSVIAAIIVIGFIAELIFEKLDIPDVLILIIVGIVISTVLEWFKPTDLGFGATLFTTFALIFILFQGALNINFKALVKSLSKTLRLTIFSFIITISIITAISYFFGYPILTAILIGTILSGTSSAVVIPLVHNVDIKDKYGLVLKLESALSDVLSIIGTITVLEIMQTGTAIPAEVFQSVFQSFSLAIIVGLSIGIIWVYLLKKHEILMKAYMITIALVIGMYVFVESDFVSGSGAIAALTFGLVLGNSRVLLTIGNNNEDKNNKHKVKTEEKTITNVLSNSAKNFYSEISFFVKTFFFVYLGMLIDFSNPLVFLFGAVLTLGIYVIRPLAVKLAFFSDSNIDTKERAILEVLIPKGLAAAVLAGVAVQSGVLNGAGAQFTNLILSVILLSIVFTSVLIFLAEKNLFKGFMPFLYRNAKK